MVQSKLTKEKLDCIYMWDILSKPLERFSELSSNISNKQKQNVQQNLRHNNVDFQCKSIELTSRDICNSFDPLSNINILGFQSLFTS